MLADVSGDSPSGASPPPSYPAAKARQGDIVLRKPWRRFVFIAGLCGAAILALAVVFLAGR